MNVNNTNIRSILLAGENNTVEFKTSINSAKHTLPKIISSFANAEGGVVIIGYDDRSSEIIGCSGHELDITKNVISKNNLDSVCNAYTVEYEKKLLIVIQVKKSENLIFADGGAYERRGEQSILLSSQETITRLVHKDENTEKQSTKESIERLEKKLVEILEEMKHSQEMHEEELAEQKSEHEDELKKAKKSNWFFCILSAVIGCVLGKLL